MEDMAGALMDEMLDGALDGILDGILSGAMDSIMDELLPIIQGVLWLIILFSLPLVVFAVFYCFFGLRTYKGLLIVDSVLNAGWIGALILAILIGPNCDSIGGVIAAAIVGYILFGAGFGVLAKFFPTVFLCIHALFLGVIQVSMIFMSMKINGIVSLVLGSIIGIALLVLIIIYKKWLIMGTHAFKGAYYLAAVFQILVLAIALDISAASVCYWIGLIGFAVGGFFVQYNSDKKRPVMLDGKKVVYMNQQYQQPVNNMNNQPYQQPVNNMNNQPYQQPVMGVCCKLIGLEGMYKGFEFDIEKQLVIGRDVDRCNIIFPDGTKGVSRVQCELSINEETGAVSIIDNFSSYGTSVNGVKLNQGVAMYLNTGDVIMFGENNVFKIQY